MEPVTILDCLVDDLKRRQHELRADRHRHTFYLKELDPEKMMEVGYISLLAGMRKEGTLVEIISGIGRQIRTPLKLPMDSVSEVHTGWFVMVSFLELGILEYYTQKAYGKNSGKPSQYPTYHFAVKDWDAISQLMTLINKEHVAGMLPSRTPPDNWLNEYHSTGTTVVKKMHRSLKGQLSPEKQPILFGNLNKLQNTAWRVNPETFNVFQQCFKQAKDPKIKLSSPFKFSSEENRKRKESLMREVEAISNIAQLFLNEPFYHMYNYDFRYRLYVMTAYLHEQSSDNAKGLLIFDDGVPFGPEGFYWFKIHMSNTFGHDKDTKDGRAQFTSANIAEWIEFAKNPLKNRDWMKADAPFSFLSCCFELKKIRDWLMAGYTIDTFVSHIPCYIDGSTNGTQHLTALSKDETIAHLVNLVPSEKPGDLYMYIAGHTWDIIHKMYEKTLPKDLDRFQEIWQMGLKLHADYAKSPLKSEQRALAYQTATEWRNQTRAIRTALFPVYWKGVDNPKDQRKAVKRPVMTLGYGGTAYGMGQQVNEDTKGMSDYLRDKEPLWGAMLGKLVYDQCYTHLPGPARMLRLFKELAEIANSRDEFLQWTVPITNAPVIQAYRKAVTKRTKLTYGDDELKVQIEAWDETTIDYDAVITGAAPNIVHSYDAGHLAIVVYMSYYPMSVIHDSFGCHAGNMHHLFKLARSEFVNFYETDPLALLLEELMVPELMPERGNLDIKLIMKSDYAFL